jgi:hypothetical protein
LAGSIHWLFRNEGYKGKNIRACKKKKNLKNEKRKKKVEKCPNPLLNNCMR